jgi:hypothetical protein
MPFTQASLGNPPYARVMPSKMTHLISDIEGNTQELRNEGSINLVYSSGALGADDGVVMDRASVETTC